MKKTYFFILLGLAMMAGGLFGLTLKIDVHMHYFGNGVIFGVGLSILINSIIRLKRKK